MFPLVLLLQAAATPAPPPPAPAPWSAVTRTNPADGTKATSAFAMSRDGSARLTVRCDTVKMPVVSIQLRTRAPMAASGDQAVSVKIDSADPIQAAWQFPGVAMLNTSPEIVTSVTAALVNAHSIVVATGPGPLTINEEFDGPASPDGIKAVLDACGYQIGVVPPAPDDKKK